MGSESVPDLEDMHVHAKAGWTVDAGVGEVLEPVPSIKPRKWVETDAGRADDLRRAAEVLHAKFVVAEESGASPSVNGDYPVWATHGEAWHQGGHEAGFSCRCKFSCGGKQSHVEFQAVGPLLPSPRKPKDRSNVILLKVILLVLPKRRSAAQADSWAYADQSDPFCSELSLFLLPFP